MADTHSGLRILGVNRNEIHLLIEISGQQDQIGQWDSPLIQQKNVMCECEI